MSDKLMDTVPGGETPQYESIQTVTKPNAKQGGHLGDPQDKTETADSKPLSDAEASERSTKTTENIRYGQNVSETGMGGMTTTSDGSGNAGSSYGGAADDESSKGGAAGQRRAAGYGGGQDMDREVGA